jgi:glycosyltransferase involved in cell wall biosynthesis
MAADAIKVLHIDCSHEWRGGQQQASYLVQAMTAQGFHTAMACPAKSPLADFCTSNHIKHFPFQIKSEFDVSAATKLARMCHDNEYQILHAHDAHALAVASMAKLFFSSLIVIAARRVDFHVKKPIIGAYKYTNRRVNHIITVSEKIRDILIEDGVPAEKITTVHSGIDIHKFDHIQKTTIREEFGIPSDHFVLGTVAAIAGHKDYPTLLRAAKIVTEQDEHITFIAVGKGPDEDSVKSMADELSVKRFHFAGFRPDVGEFLKTFDAFVLSSKTEGLGTSLLDAQAVGLPIVATAAGGIPEIVHDGVNGVLAPIQNPEALAEKIMQLKKDKELQSKFSKNALQQVKAFDVSETVRKTINVYKACL